jgi:hypothetical protein
VYSYVSVMSLHRRRLFGRIFFSLRRVDLDPDKIFFNKAVNYLATTIITMKQFMNIKVNNETINLCNTFNWYSKIFLVEYNA